MSTQRHIAVYISAHGYGHFTRTQNFLSLFGKFDNYIFHIRTSSPLYPEYLFYDLHPSVIQTTPYDLDVDASLASLYGQSHSYRK